MKLKVLMSLALFVCPVLAGPSTKSPQEKKIERQIEKQAKEAAKQQRRQLLKDIKQAVQNPATLPKSPPVPGLTPVGAGAVVEASPPRELANALPTTPGTHKDIGFTYV